MPSRDQAVIALLQGLRRSGACCWSASQQGVSNSPRSAPRLTGREQPKKEPSQSCRTRLRGVGAASSSPASAAARRAARTSPRSASATPGACRRRMRLPHPGRRHRAPDRTLCVPQDHSEDDRRTAGAPRRDGLRGVRRHGSPAGAVSPAARKPRARSGCAPTPLSTGAARGTTAALGSAQRASVSASRRRSGPRDPGHQLRIAGKSPSGRLRCCCRPGR